MLVHISAISSLLIGIGFFLVGNGLLGTLLQLRGVAEGYSTSTIGFFMSAYYCGFFIGGWLCPRVIRRVGHIRAFVLFASLAAITVLLHALFIHPWVWLGLRFVFGIVLMGVYTVIESWLNAQTPQKLRGRIFSIYMVANFIALAAGQQFIKLDATLGFAVFSIAAIAMCASLTPITLTRRIQPVASEQKRASLLKLLKIAPLPLVASCLAGLNASAFWGMGSVYAELKGFNTSEIATLMSLTILGGALLQYPIGRLSDRYDRRTVLFFVTFFAAIFSAIMLLTKDKQMLLVFFCIWSGLTFTIYPLAVAQLIDQLTADETLAGSGSLLLINGVGAIFGPAVAGALMLTTLKAQALPLLFLCVTSVLSIYTLYRVKFVKVKISEPLAQYKPMMNTSQSALDLLPEQHENYFEKIIEEQSRVLLLTYTPQK